MSQASQPQLNHHGWSPTVGGRSGPLVKANATQTLNVIVLSHLVPPTRGPPIYLWTVMTARPEE